MDIRGGASRQQGQNISGPKTVVGRGQHRPLRGRALFSHLGPVLRDPSCSSAATFRHCAYPPRPNSPGGSVTMTTANTAGALVPEPCLTEFSTAPGGTGATSPCTCGRLPLRLLGS